MSDEIEDLEPIQTIQDLDDEMQNLFEELDTTILVDDTQSESTTPESTTPESTAPESITPESITPEAPLPFEPPKQHVIKAVAITQEASLPLPIEEPIVDLRKEFKQLDDFTTEVLQGTRGDRQETQDAINLMRQEIDKAIQAKIKPERMFVDNLAKALEVKATINMTAVKAMEVKAKMLAATKAGVVVNTNIQNNQTNNSTDQGLVDLLNNAPLASNGDDEY